VILRQSDTLQRCMHHTPTCCGIAPTSFLIVPTMIFDSGRDQVWFGNQDSKHLNSPNETGCPAPEETPSFFSKRANTQIKMAFQESL